MSSLLLIVVGTVTFTEDRLYQVLVCYVSDLFSFYVQIRDNDEVSGGRREGGGRGEGRGGRRQGRGEGGGRRQGRGEGMATLLVKGKAVQYCVVLLTGYLSCVGS